jgi:hypothetical protein
MSTLQRPVAAAPRHAGLIKSHPLLSFYIIAFAVSWGVISSPSGLVRADSPPPHSSCRRRSRTRSRQCSPAPA